MNANHIDEAKSIIKILGLPKAQQNDRSALCFLALLNLTPEKSWQSSENPLMGITPIMDWVFTHYRVKYAPNTRETFRRQSMHQFYEAGIALYNPDDPGRPVNSPRAVYQIAPDVLALLRKYGTASWESGLASYLKNHPMLSDEYAKSRRRKLIPVKITAGEELLLSPGKHNELIRNIVEDFAPRFAPGSLLLYVGDTGGKWSYFDKRFSEITGIEANSHGKIPDVILFQEIKN